MQSLEYEGLLAGQHLSFCCLSNSWELVSAYDCENTIV